MKNSKVVVLNGFSRGGTNVVWNLLQSHPDICCPILETGQLVHDQLFAFPRKFLRLPRRNWTRRLLSTPQFLDSKAGQILQRRIDQLFFDWKMKNLGDPDNGMKFEGVPYTEEEVEQSVLCLKSTDDDILLLECLRRMYPDLYSIGLVRDGYSLCTGRLRRGQDVNFVGRQYHRIGQEMIRKAADQERFCLMRFDEVLADPFAAAQSLFKFCDLQPIELTKLRLESKAVLTAEREHKLRFGESKRKYWFDRETIATGLDPNIDRLQASMLSEHDRRCFEHHAAPVLRQMGYLTESGTKTAA